MKLAWAAERPVSGSPTGRSRPEAVIRWAEVVARKRPFEMVTGAALQPGPDARILPRHGTGMARSGMAEEQAPEAQVTPGRDVFISYASQDKAVAESVCKALEGAGLACWIAPRDVVPGESFAGAIVHAIDATKVIVLVLSEHAADSQHVLREVERAASKRHAVIAFRLDLKPLPADFEYFLNTSQWLDASTTGVRRALPKLVEAVSGATAQAPAKSGAIQTRNTATAVHKRWRPALIGSVAIALGSVAYLLINRFQISKPGTTPPLATSVKQLSVPEVSEKSIAVLPFVDMSEKHDQEYLSDGLSEELIDMLAKVPDLRVPARTSSFYFKGKPDDIATIAKRLKVGHVLEGSVRKAGSHVRITAQLVRADNGYHLWSETYDRQLDDLFKVQDEIASKVVQALKVSLGAGAPPHSNRAMPAEAHTLLLQADSLADRDTEDDCRRADDYYQKVIQLDPSAAVAWAGKAAALACTALYGHQTGSLQMRARAFDAAKKAVALDAKLARAHGALALVLFSFDWDWAGADAEFAIARTLDPKYSFAVFGAGQVAALRGHLSDALQLWQQAIVNDPLNVFAYGEIASAYFAMGRLKEAAAAARTAVELNPAEPGVHGFLAQVLLAQGQERAALAEIDKEPDAGFQSYSRARTAIVSGRKADADAALARVTNNFADEQPYNIATLYALRGERDQAFSWLNRAFQRHDSIIVGVPAITVDPDMRNLRGDPRFKAYLKKLNLPE